MAINVFEGARRIAKLLAILWVGGWVIAAFYVSPSVDVTYKIVTPGAAPIKITEACPADSTTEHVYDKVTQSGTKTVVTLCFPKPRFSVAEALEEIKAEEMKTGKVQESGPATFKVKTPDGSIMNISAPPGATEEQAIEFAAAMWKPQSTLKDAFVLPQSDEKWIDGQWWLLAIKEIGWGALGAVSGLLFLLAFTWTTGWIVRGFMGIPRGQDHRVKSDVEVMS